MAGEGQYDCAAMWLWHVGLALGRLPLVLHMHPIDAKTPEDRQRRFHGPDSHCQAQGPHGARLVECIFDAVDQYLLDVVTWNMIHSRPWQGATRLKACSPFAVLRAHDRIDVGSIAVRGPLAKAAGFRDKASDGGAAYFSDVLRGTGQLVRIGKIDKSMLVDH